MRQLMLHLGSKLDTWLYRRPFEGSSARRYVELHRPGFGDLDDRLIARWRTELDSARTVLDIGSGPGTFVSRLAGACPHLTIVALEPSAALAGSAPAGWSLRGCAESLPLADQSIDIAVCLSSIRHVRDRRQALREMRRVVARAVYIVELDPLASRRRILNHTRSFARLTWLSRVAFGPLVVRTAPSAEAIAGLARGAGWPRIQVQADPVQPFYIMRLSR